MTLPPFCFARDPPPSRLCDDACCFSLTTALPAHASGSSMPWEEPLQQILQSIEGSPRSLP